MAVRSINTGKEDFIESEQLSLSYNEVNNANLSWCGSTLSACMGFEQCAQ